MQKSCLILQENSETCPLDQSLRHSPHCTKRRLHLLYRLRQVERVSRAPELWHVRTLILFPKVLLQAQSSTAQQQHSIVISLLTGLIYEINSTKGICYPHAGILQVWAASRKHSMSLNGASPISLCLPGFQISYTHQYILRRNCFNVLVFVSI